MKKRKTGTLPDVTFGVEIECAMPRWNGLGPQLPTQLEAASFSTSYGRKNYQRWSIHHDGGTHDQNYTPWEIISPILRGEEGLAELQRMMATLKGMGGKAGMFCGMHVHVSTAGLSEEQIRWWRAAYVRFARCIDRLLPHYRVVNGYGASSVVSPTAKRNCVQAERAKPLYYGRGSAFSLRGSDHSPDWRHMKTVELRAHQSTLDGEKAANWVRLMLHLRERAIHDKHGGFLLVDGATQAEVQKFLDYTQAPKPVRRYWLEQAERYRCDCNTDLTPVDLQVLEMDAQRKPQCQPWAKRRAA